MSENTPNAVPMTASARAEELNRIYGCNLATDEAHWAEYGIFTSEQLDEYLDVSFRIQNGADEVDESMDGDFDSGMASAGFGTDEDYGYYGSDE
jgi:hypothetical protein